MRAGEWMSEVILRPCKRSHREGCESLVARNDGPSPPACNIDAIFVRRIRRLRFADSLCIAGDWPTSIGWLFIMDEPKSLAEGH
jgi:hypothetical protein